MIIIIIEKIINKRKRKLWYFPCFLYDRFRKGKVKISDKKYFLDSLVYNITINQLMFKISFKEMQLALKSPLVLDLQKSNLQHVMFLFC